MLQPSEERVAQEIAPIQNYIDAKDLHVIGQQSRPVLRQGVCQGNPPILRQGAYTSLRPRAKLHTRLTYQFHFL